MNSVRITFDLGNVPTMIQRWKQLKALEQAVGETALYLRGKVSEYPRVRSRPMRFVSARQRRAFFAMLRAGDIEVPYRRGMSPGSETLGRRWAVERSNSGLTATVGNNVKYAQYVVGERQASYHKGNWVKTGDVVKRETPAVQRIFDKHIRRAL